jgi:TATA-box binding protein (TBP) (component of TFIID and TFIIIB)
MLSTIESFQKDLSNLVTDFEEYSQRKYPVFVLRLKKKKTNRLIFIFIYIELIKQLKRFISIK